LTSSGTYALALSNASILMEAFDRIGHPPPMVDRHMMMSARNSLNLEMIEWEDDGMVFWKTASGTVTLAAGTGTYALPTNLVTLTELWYSTVNGGGTGVNADRLMTPLTRSSYAAIANKNQTDIPTAYWFQMLATPQVTVWQVPVVGAPTYALNWYGLQQMQDAGISGGETPDAPRRALSALTAKMALRLCEKFGPKEPQARRMMMEEKKTIADEAYGKMVRRDQEPGPMIIQPNISAYGRMRR